MRTLRIAAVAIVAVAALALLEAPGRFPGPVRQLARHSLNTPDPVSTAYEDVGALRKAARLVPAGATYAVVTPPGSDVQLVHDFEGSAHLLLLPALAVADPTRADWLLRFRAARPPAVHVVRTYPLGNGVVLERLRP